MKKVMSVVMAILMTTGLLWAQQPLPITQVLLSKNGMAYIVRAGQISAPVSLTFHPEDMNDVLKSFTAWNPSTNALYSVGYTTGIPSSYMLGRFPFDISNANIGLGGFLTQVKGASVRLVMEKTIEGKLVAVQESEHVLAQQTISTDYRLTVLLQEGNLQTVWLSEVRSIEFVDPALRDQLRSYLEVLSDGRQDVTREVSIYPGTTPGPIRVAYLQQFPLWKTSYRVDLGKTDSKIQGWAQIDNPTGESWDNVEVSLLSGTPVSFVMNMYDPLYTNRATLAVPGGQVAAPRQYEASLKSEESLGQRGAGAAAAPRVAAAPPPPPAPAAGGRGGGAGGGARGGAPAQQGQGQGQQSALASELTFAQAQSTQIEDFFEYKFPFPVRLASRQSALLPFLQKNLNIERLSIYNPRTDRGNPQLGARMENTADIPFEAGPVTFFESGRYTGEALLDYMARGEKRLVSYGVDHEIQVSNKNQVQPETTTRVTVANGIAVLYMERVQTTTYEIKNKSTSAKTLIVEHPRNPSGKLKGEPPWETSDSYYRFRVSLTPGKSSDLAVAETLSRQSNVTLSSLTRAQLVQFAGKETPDMVRQRLGQIVDTQERIAALQNDAATTQSQIDVVFRDQDRLRDNITVLRDTREDQELRSRYLGQLKSQEDQVATWRTHIDTVNKDIAAQKARLGDLISTLSWQ